MKSVRASKSGRTPALLALFTTVFLLAFLAKAGSGDPWKSKPYQQWDDKDIAKVFTGSPWSHSVTVEETWQPLDAAEKAAASGAAAPGAVAGTQGMSGGTGKMATALPAEHSDARTRGEDVPFTVYWVSSRTFRSAQARKAVLHSGKDPAEADKFVNQPMDQYVVLVQGKEMDPFSRNDEKFFEHQAFLIVKKTKQQIAPIHVVYNRDPKTKLVEGVFFLFPKKSPSGENTIAPDEKSVEFDCKLGHSTLKAYYEPQKMNDATGSDL
jgi:hypothetical protein